MEKLDKMRTLCIIIANFWKRGELMGKLEQSKNTDLSKTLKLDKETRFRLSKNKTLALVLTGALVTISSIYGLTKVFNKEKFNFNNYDTILTPSFSSELVNQEIELDEVSLDSKNNYYAKLYNGEIIYTSPTNAILLDNDYIERGEKEISKELTAYPHALVNYFNNLERHAIYSTSLEKPNGQPMYVFDTHYVRLMVPVQSAVVYKHLTPEEAANYTNPAEISTAYIIVDGKQIPCKHFIGYKDVKIEGVDFRAICAYLEDEGYCEYLTTKEQIVFIRPKSATSESVKGVELNYGQAKGNFNSSYNAAPDMYKDIESIILLEDGMYCVTTTDGSEIIISPRYYSFEYLKEKPKYYYEGFAVRLNGYCYTRYNINGFAFPMITEGVNLSSIGNTALYFIQPSNDTDLSHGYPVRSYYGSIYSPYALTLGRIANKEEILHNPSYTLVEGNVNFLINVNGNYIALYEDSDAINFLDINFFAYAQTEYLGIKYYSLITEKTSKNGDVFYIETLVPTENVCILGTEQKMAPVKSVGR